MKEQKILSLDLFYYLDFRNRLKRWTCQIG